jgi:hypothetical protein
VEELQQFLQLVPRAAEEVVVHLGIIQPLDQTVEMELLEAALEEA